MIKKIILGIVAVAAGIGTALFAYSFFREQIQHIFLWSTSNRIRFVGKNFYFFGSSFYHLNFGIAFLLLAFGNFNKQRKTIAKNIILSILIFSITVIGISSIDAHIKIIECTACNDGIRRINWNEINYGLILGISILIAIIPNLILWIKNRRKIKM